MQQYRVLVDDLHEAQANASVVRSGRPMRSSAEQAIGPLATIPYNPGQVAGSESAHPSPASLAPTSSPPRAAPAPTPEPAAVPAQATDPLSSTLHELSQHGMAGATLAVPFEHDGRRGLAVARVPPARQPPPGVAPASSAAAPPHACLGGHASNRSPSRLRATGRAASPAGTYHAAGADRAWGFPRTHLSGVRCIRR